MRSPVHWALLGLVIEEPSYAYDLARRFQRRYGAALPLNDVRHVYTALRALSARALIECQEPGEPPTPGRPGARYQATTAGERAYEAWLVTQAEADRRQFELFVLALSALARDPGEMLEVLDHCELALLEESKASPLLDAKIRVDAPAGDHADLLIERLHKEELRLAVGAKLEWLRYAREELRQQLVDPTPQRT